VEHPPDSSQEDGCENHEHECGDAQTSSHTHSHPRPHSPPHDTGSALQDAPDQHLTAPILHSHLQSPHNGPSNGDIPGVPSSRIHTRSASTATFSSLSPPPPTSPTIPHSHTVPSLAPKAHGHRTHSRRAPSLQLHDARLSTSHLEGAVNSPVTPSYRFGEDEHFASHLHGHTPNLHDHSHVHGTGHSREGHSHNMRGLFLHVMAVSSCYLLVRYLLTEVLRVGHIDRTR
jgi:solute carrier family 30 (zinc transporter), member 5/7